MFKKSATNTNGSLFTGINQRIGLKKSESLDNPLGWQNVFFQEITSKIEETAYSVLYSGTTGRRNAPVRQLLSMMILKEGNGWTDEQLFEECRFNLLVMRALGLQDLLDEPPVASTYYDFKAKLAVYYEQTGIDLLSNSFSSLTSDQVIRYHVSGKGVRMDSKLLASNIARCTRLQLVLSVLQNFHKNLDRDLIKVQGISVATGLAEKDWLYLKDLSSKTVSAHTYSMTNEDKAALLKDLGTIIQRIVKDYSNKSEEAYLIVERLFSEQYEIVNEKEHQGNPPSSKTQESQSRQPKELRVELRDKKELTGSILQSAHDTDATFRRKDSGQKSQQIKGYSSNITENCTPGELGLILAVQVENAGHSDAAYFQPALEESQKVLNAFPQTVATDGAYNSEANQAFITQQNKQNEEETKWHLTAIQGKQGDLEYEWIMVEGQTEPQLQVHHKPTGLTQIATKVIPRPKTKDQTPRYRIKLADGKYRYITQHQIDTYFRRLEIAQLPAEIKNMRPNVEATIHQVFCNLNGQQSKYRGILAHRHLVFARCFWVNCRRIKARLTKLANKTPENTLFQLLFSFFTLCSFIANHNNKQRKNLKNTFSAFLEPNFVWAVN